MSFAVSTPRAALDSPTVRAGAGPRLLHALTYRVKGHVSVDAPAYRDGAEISKPRCESDPLHRARDS